MIVLDPLALLSPSIKDLTLYIKTNPCNSPLIYLPQHPELSWKMETKMNSSRWRSIIHRDVFIKKIEAYLGNDASTKSYLELRELQIPLQTLVEDTDYRKAPTTEWYTIHMCVQDERKWHQGMIAWGLNRTRVNMYELQHDIVSHIMEERDEAIKQKKTTDMAMLPLLPIEHKFRQAYQNMAPRFVGAVVPVSWYIDAQHQFIALCKRSAISMLDKGFYDQKIRRWSKAGIDNWKDLYRSSDSPDDLVRSSFALVETSEDKPPRESVLSPVHIQNLPTEIDTRVLDFVFSLPILQQESELVKNDRRVQENAWEWSCHRTVTIRAINWPQNPPRRFPAECLPVKWLQSLEKVEFDFDGVRYSNRQTVHPVMEQLAEIWKIRNELQSLTLPVAPDMTYLLQQNPRVELDHVQKGIFAPLLEIRNLEPRYAVDFKAPVNEFEWNALCELLNYKNQYYKRSLGLVLGMSEAFINAKFGEKHLTPLHLAVYIDMVKTTELVLSVPGIDVNARSRDGKTAFNHAMYCGNVEQAILLTHHKNFMATERDFLDAVKDTRKMRVFPHLSNAYGGVPACVADHPMVCRVILDAGQKLGNG